MTNCAQVAAAVQELHEQLLQEVGTGAEFISPAECALSLVRLHVRRALCLPGGRDHSHDAGASPPEDAQAAAAGVLRCEEWSRFCRV